MKFLFLVFVPRSGSTYFARRLSYDFPQVLVMPECRAPEILISNAGLIDSGSVRKVASALRVDRQLPALGISPEELPDLIAGSIRGGVTGVLGALAQRYCSTMDAPFDYQCVLIKNGALLPLSLLVSKLVPNSAMVHIVRDPRGVVNSNIRAKRPYFPSEAMGRGDPVFVARLWARYARLSEALASSSSIQFVELRYEDMLSDWGRVIAKMSVLFPTCRPLLTAKSIAPRIPPYEMGIHRNVSSPPLVDRVEAWRTELTKRDTIIVEVICGAEMASRGYVVGQRSGSQRLIALINGMSKHFVKTLCHFLGRIVVYVRSPALLTANLKLRRRRKWL